MKITVIGELCKDVFVYGDTLRLSPEAPVPVLTPSYKEENDGMAGNVVQNLKAMDDTLEINFIHQLEDIVKTRYVDEKSNHMFIRIDRESHIEPLMLNDEYVDMIKESDAVIVSDYNKGFLTESVLREICYHSKFIIMDTKKKVSEHTVSHFNFIKLNYQEYTKFDKDARDIYIDKLIVTLGSHGARYMDKIYPSPDPKETIDVSGAGDTFLAAFVVKFLESQDVQQAILYANELSSVVVSKKGVVTP